MTREWVDKMLALRAILGDDTLITELINWLGKAGSEEFIEQVTGCHDISAEELEQFT